MIVTNDTWNTQIEPDTSRRYAQQWLPLQNFYVPCTRWFARRGRKRNATVAG